MSDRWFVFYYLARTVLVHHLFSLMRTCEMRICTIRDLRFDEKMERKPGVWTSFVFDEWVCWQVELKPAPLGLFVKSAKVFLWEQTENKSSFYRWNTLTELPRRQYIRFLEKWILVFLKLDISPSAQQIIHSTAIFTLHLSVHDQSWSIHKYVRVTAIQEYSSVIMCFMCVTACLYWTTTAGPTVSWCLRARHSRCEPSGSSEPARRYMHTVHTHTHSSPSLYFSIFCICLSLYTLKNKGASQCHRRTFFV